MAIPTTLESLSTTAASNGPAGSEQRTLADDGLRQGYAFTRQLASEGSNLASASTVTPPSTGYQFDITGTTTITTIASTNSWNGRRVLFLFQGALTLTHSSNLDLPGAANITTAAGDAAEFVQTGSGAWLCFLYCRGATHPPLSGTYTPTLTNSTNVASSTSFTAYYTRVGDVVSVHGSITVDPTAAAETLIYLSLPIASSLSSLRQLAGTAAGAAATAYGVVTGDTDTDTALLRFIAASTAAETWQYHFSYVVA